jgi:hypothetical protein
VRIHPIQENDQIWRVTGQTVRKVLIRRILPNGQLAVSRFIEGAFGRGAFGRTVSPADPADLFPTKIEAITEWRRRQRLIRCSADRRIRLPAQDALASPAP